MDLVIQEVTEGKFIQKFKGDTSLTDFINHDARKKFVIVSVK